MNSPLQLMAIWAIVSVIGFVTPASAQPFFGEQPPPDVSPEAQPTPPLFIPVKPGVPQSTPIPVATPIPASTPGIPPLPEESSPFVPSAIPPPAIQATGETIDLIPFVEPPAATGAKPTPTPRKRAAPAPPPQQISQSQINSWVSRATEKRDAGLATQIGWAYFNRNEYSSASIWFAQALEWNPKLGEAAYGQALSKFREGDISSAEAIANYRAGSYPKMMVLQGDIYSRRGTEAYEVQNYADSLEYFNKASALRPLSRNERVIVAWDLFYTKQYEQSADMFEKLYRNNPDEVSAQGLYASLSKLKAYDRLDAISSDMGGPLQKVYMTYDARRYYEANLFHASADSGGDKVYPILQNLNTPNVTAGIGYRTKSGTEGEGQLQAITIPAVDVQVFPANKFILSGYLSHLSLDSGDLPNGAWVGTVPRSYVPYTYKPNTSENDLWEWGIRLEYQDWLSWYIALGSTPLNGPIQSAPTGNAGLIWRDVHGYVQAEVYSKSIKESMTSWVGSVDPYTGKKWGRVTETGANVSIFRSIGEDNTIFIKGGYGTIDGNNTKDNNHLYGTVALAHIFDVPGYEYVSLGVSLSYESFDNNQNHFTYGNGGYFSPQYLAQGLLQGQFLTEEGRNWIAAGSAGVGVQNNTQDASPFFPLDDDGREYDSVETSSGIGLIQLQGAYLINPQWAIGGSFNYAVTADYNEGGLMLWGRYYFEPRRGLLRNDLRGFERW